MASTAFFFFLAALVAAVIVAAALIAAAFSLSLAAHIANHFKAASFIAIEPFLRSIIVIIIIIIVIIIITTITIVREACFTYYRSSRSVECA